MDLLDILKMRGFDMQAKTKVLRHQDRRFDIEKLFRDGLIEAYQSVQTQKLLSCESPPARLCSGQRVARRPLSGRGGGWELSV